MQIKIDYKLLEETSPIRVQSYSVVLSCLPIHCLSAKSRAPIPFPKTAVGILDL